MSHVNNYFSEMQKIFDSIDRTKIAEIIRLLVGIRRQQGRLFFIGVGGSAGNCLHAVNDFRKIAAFEAYTPLDNIAELTAMTNDEGWDSVFVNWLKNSHLKEKDGIFVLSVGGGNREKGISTNLILAMEYALEQKSTVMGIVGRDGGYTARVAKACLVVPTVNPNFVTPLTESVQSLILHLIVSDPRIIKHSYKWESIE